MSCDSAHIVMLSMRQQVPGLQRVYSHTPNRVMSAQPSICKCILQLAQRLSSQLPHHGHRQLSTAARAADVRDTCIIMRQGSRWRGMPEGWNAMQLALLG